MDTYYQPEDLLKFEDIGKDAQPLAQKFLLSANKHKRRQELLIIHKSFH